MEHTINLELKLNDDAMIGNALNKATEELVKQLKSTIFDKKYGWGHSWGCDSTVLSDKGKEIIKEWLNENKQELYELIAQKVAMSVMRSKKFRDILDEEIEKGDGGNG